MQLLVAFGVCALGIPALAGPLDPPAGPITSTAKPLAEVEPRIAINATNTPGDANSLYRISQPGSYYLTGNVTGVVAKHGIEIAASDVTIDLMGHTLAGPAGSLAGIGTEGVHNTITIRNGVVTGWSTGGVNLTTGGTGSTSLIEGVLATVNSTAGIRTGNNSIIRSCVARDSSENIRCGNNGLVELCATQGGTFGIFVGNDSTVRGCTVYGASFDGIAAISVGCSVIDCTSSFNGRDGIATGSGCSIRGCTTYFNSEDGIDASVANTIDACTSYDNTLDGINALEGSGVTHCTVRLNSSDGIEVSSDCSVSGNRCDNNGAGAISDAGIHATGSDNRIEGNSCTDNTRGLKIVGAGNIILRNTCSGNTTNYDIAIGNSVGPIVAAGTNAAAIAGSAAVGTLGSADPWANFSY